MSYQISTVGAVSFLPANEKEEILQNVRTILATRLGSVPLDRDFGLTWEHLDKPYPVAKSLMTAAIIEAIQKYESRVNVEAVEFDGDEAMAMEGLLKPRVIVSIKGEGSE